MTNTGDNIKKLRTSHRWTQLELAKISGMTEQYISAIERGERNAGKKTITRLCEAFAVSEEMLRYGNQRGRYTRQEMELLATLREDREKFALVLDIVRLSGEAVPFVREAVRLMQRYPEK